MEGFIIAFLRSACFLSTRQHTGRYWTLSQFTAVESFLLLTEPSRHKGVFSQHISQQGVC